MRTLLLFKSFLSFALPSFALFYSAQASAELRDGRSSVPVEVTQVAARVSPGSIVVLSEIHDSKTHHNNQSLFLSALASSPSFPLVSVGMEFFEYSQQPLVDSYLQGKLDEPSFLKQVKWGSIPFDFYRNQVQFPLTHGGYTIGLNASRTLTSKIAKTGLASLTPQERAELPEGFQLGNSNYFERFKAAMGSHVPPNAISRYFEAQSVWDETMASQAISFLQAHPYQVLVILVGDFHAAYFGGLPDRIRARGFKAVTVISQVATKDLSPAEIKEAIEPHPKWGPRADYVWVTLD